MVYGAIRLLRVQFPLEHFLLSFLHSLYFPVETIMIESPGYSNLSLYLTRALAMAILCFCPLYLSPCT